MASKFAARLAAKAKEEKSNQDARQESLQVEGSMSIKSAMAKAAPGQKANLSKVSDQARQAAKARRLKQIATGLKSGQPKVSMKQVLASCGMERYYPYFRDAGVDVIHHYERQENVEVEFMIDSVEKFHEMKIPFPHKALIFKAIRMRWFGDPKRVAPYIDPASLPRLFLAKRDHRYHDADTEIGKIESERQRMICRQTVKEEGGEETKRVQFEVRLRHPEFYYELRDVQRCVTEWRTWNPRQMLREDPREEFFLQRIHKLERDISENVAVEKEREAKMARHLNVLRLLRFALMALAIVLVDVAFNEHRDGVPQMLFVSTVSARQFTSAVSFMTAYFFSHGVATHKKANRKLIRCNIMHEACKKLGTELSNFRLESMDKRVDKFEDVMATLAAHFGLKGKEPPPEPEDPNAPKNFDSWFKDVMARPFNKYDIGLEMEESHQIMPDYADLPLIPKDRIVDRTEDMRKAAMVEVNEHTRLAAPSAAMGAESQFYNASRQEQQLALFEAERARLERRAAREAQGLEVSSESSDED